MRNSQREKALVNFYYNLILIYIIKINFVLTTNYKIYTIR